MKTQKTIRATTFYLVVSLIFVTSVFLQRLAHAQTVEQVASEVDQVEVDLATVNSKADQATGKANSLELRVSELEARPTVDPTLEARVTALENSTPPAYDDTELRSRITALEASATIPKIVARDSLNQFVGSWFDRSAVSVGFYDLPGVGEIRFRVTPDAIKWIGAIPSEGLTYYTNSTCGADGSSPVQKIGDYAPADLDSGDWFGGLHELFVNTRPDGSVWFSRLDTSVTVTSGDLFQKSATGCPFKVRGAMIHPAVHVAEAPFFVPPFVVGIEQ